MSFILILMLFCQAGMLLASAWTIAGRKPTTTRPRPIWSSLAVQLFAIAATSNIIGRHEPGVGAVLVRYGAGILLGMAMACGLIDLRDRRGLDRLA